MPSRREFLGAAATLAGAAAAAATGTLRAEPLDSGVRVRVLGTVQDGGKPQLGCERPCCVAARRDPSRARRVASLGLFGGTPGSVSLVDATPDIRSQISELRENCGIEAAPGLPVDRILLTHAHTGHYAGLIHLGRESMAARSVPLVVTSRMGDFLKSNKPWSRLVEWGHVKLETIEPGKRAGMGPGLAIEAIAVPHRDEDSDTLGFVFSGPTRKLLYVPDTDAWEKWRRPLEEYLAEVDVALLDGTFFDGGELPGRDVSQVPHPLMTTTMAMLGKEAAAGRCRILFTHLNHSNPALDPDATEAALVRESGFEIAREGMEFPL